MLGTVLLPVSVGVEYWSGVFTDVHNDTVNSMGWSVGVECLLMFITVTNH